MMKSGNKKDTANNKILKARSFSFAHFWMLDKILNSLSACNFEIREVMRGKVRFQFKLGYTLNGFRITGLTYILDLFGFRSIVCGTAFMQKLL